MDKDIEYIAACYLRAAQKNTFRRRFNVLGVVLPFISSPMQMGVDGDECSSLVWLRAFFNAPETERDLCFWSLSRAQFGTWMNQRSRSC